MAQKRMFSLKIIDTDMFLDMPISAQNLYFHLNMRADDDGFISNYKKIKRIIGSSDDDMTILLSKDFVIPFESGVCVIKHWKIHNYIAKDRYHGTIYTEEMQQLEQSENGAYTKCIQIVDKMSTQSRLDKISIDKISIDKSKISNTQKKQKPKPIKHKYGEYNNVLLTDDEYKKLNNKIKDLNSWIVKMDEGIEMKGYKYKSHYLAILSWYRKEQDETNKSVPRDEQENIDYSEGWEF